MTYVRVATYSLWSLLFDCSDKKTCCSFSRYSQSAIALATC